MTILIALAIVVIALVLGFVIGYHEGYTDGYDEGLKNGCQLADIQHRLDLSNERLERLKRAISRSPHEPYTGDTT